MSLCLADADSELLVCLAGADDPAFSTFKVQYADVLGRAPSGKLQDRCMELELETGDAPMPLSRPVKRLIDGELECFSTSTRCSTARGGLASS